MVLTAGSLADRLGRRGVFAAGLGIFAVASLAAGLAPDATFLNISRAVQGIGAAAMFSVSLALVAQEFPAGRERAMAMGVYGATIGVAVAVGPLVGGAITDGLGWRWVFFINVPIGIAMVATTFAKLRESRDPNATRVDWLGLGSLSGGLLMLVLALLRGNDEGWGSPLILELLAGAALMLAAFTVIEQHRCSRSSSISRSTCRTTSATRRSRLGCATCRSRWRRSSWRRWPSHCWRV